MQVVVVSGSPRKNANTQLIMNYVVEYAKTKNVDVKFINLSDGQVECYKGPEEEYNDATKNAANDLMNADVRHLQHFNGFNISPMSFSAGELADEIKKHVPNFKCRFEPDDRQAIADSWPQSMDESAARQEWGWKASFGLETMTADILQKLAS